MKKQILEVQNYFVQKVLKNEYSLVRSEMASDGWFRVDIIVDEFELQFSLQGQMLCVHQSPIFFCRDQKESILKSFEHLIKEAKIESIRKLKDTLAALEA